MAVSAERRRLTTPKIHALAPWATLVAAVGLAITDVILSIVTPGYDMAAETSSQLMSPDARYSELARVFLAMYAVLLIPFAVGLPGRFIGTPTVAGVAVTAMWVHIVAALVSAVAMNDSDAGLVGGLSANDVHDQAALVMFGGAFFTLQGCAMAYRTRLRHVRLLNFIALGMMLTVGPFFVAEVWTEVNGVTERILAAAFLVWLAVTAWSWRNEVRSATS